MRRSPTSGRVITATAAVTAAVLLAACGSQSAVQSGDNLVAGKQLFVERCGSCHTLARAGTSGTQGPNLDAAFRQSISEGFGRSAVRGVVVEQIKHPMGNEMPADLVKGDEVTDVAGYVALTAARGGEDTGLLATAVPEAGGGGPAVAENGEIQIDADPNGQLAYVTDEARAEAGPLTVRMDNPSGVPHNIVLEDVPNAEGEVVGQGGVSEFQADVKPGEYVYFCSVPGHREGGMEGTLTVR
ncbi:MAG TPA: plastocyanin/azurin family copper-binding protein [Capillimicrobium sp.]|jgi:plastocyanin/cytochrome c5